jgi:hypothetical protein
MPFHIVRFSPQALRLWKAEYPTGAPGMAAVHAVAFRSCLTNPLGPPSQVVHRDLSQSCSVKVRPIRALTPSARKKSPLT